MADSSKIMKGFANYNQITLRTGYELVIIRPHNKHGDINGEEKVKFLSGDKNRTKLPFGLTLREAIHHPEAGALLKRVAAHWGLKPDFFSKLISKKNASERYLIHKINRMIDNRGFSGTRLGGWASRRETIKELAGFNHPAARDVLTGRAIYDPNYIVRITGVEALASLGVKNFLQALRSVEQNDPNSQVRSQVQRWVGEAVNNGEIKKTDWVLTKGAPYRGLLTYHQLDCENTLGRAHATCLPKGLERALY